MADEAQRIHVSRRVRAATIMARPRGKPHRPSYSQRHPVSRARGPPVKGATVPRANVPVRECGGKDQVSWVRRGVGSDVRHRAARSGREVRGMGRMRAAGVRGAVVALATTVALSGCTIPFVNIEVPFELPDLSGISLPEIDLSDIDLPKLTLPIGVTTSVDDARLDDFVFAAIAMRGVDDEAMVARATPTPSPSRAPTSTRRPASSTVASRRSRR